MTALKNVLMFAPKAAPDIEKLLATPQGTDDICGVFVKRGLLTKEEFELFNWKMKKEFIRMYLNELRAKDRENKRKSEHLEQLGETNRDGSQDAASLHLANPGSCCSGVHGPPGKKEE